MIDFNALLLILVLILIAAYWRGTLGVRERAAAAARKAVDQTRAQWLDQSISLERMQPYRMSKGGVGLRRFYRFEFSLVGDDRRTGRVIVEGRRIRHCELDMPEGRLIFNLDSE